MKSEWFFKEEVQHVLASLTPVNRLILEISLATGLRVGDVVSLPSQGLKQRMTVQEQKTGKNRRVFFPKELFDRMLYCRGKFYVFPNRNNGRKPRTVSAVYKDIKKAAKLFRIKANVTPHSMRKIYAVEEYHKHGDLDRVRRLLNHEREAVTMIYAFADELVKRRLLH